ncbi:MAG: sulfotransferase, partial [Chloroflexi bacterium]
MTVKRALDRHSLPFLAGWAVRRSARLLTAGRRRLPDFCIIGGQRCGTTSLYNYLVQHPDVSPAFMKETHFFDTHYHRGINW